MVLTIDLPSCRWRRDRNPFGDGNNGDDVGLYSSVYYALTNLVVDGEEVREDLATVKCLVPSLNFKKA